MHKSLVSGRKTHGYTRYSPALFPLLFCLIGRCSQCWSDAKWSTLLVGYPKWKVDADSGKFPLAKMLRFRLSPVGLKRDTQGGKVNNGAVHNRGCYLHLDLHTTNNFAP